MRIVVVILTKERQLIGQKGDLVKKSARIEQIGEIVIPSPLPRGGARYRLTIAWGGIGINRRRWCDWGRRWS